jgi:alkylhydroperoxidase family enzyme
VVKGAKGGGGVLATMLRNPDLYEVWRPLVSYLNTSQMIGGRQRELLILRVAWLCQSPYEWGNHAAAAPASGLSHDEIEQIKVGSSASCWSKSDSTLIRVPEELLESSTLTDSTWNKLIAEYEPDQLIEIIMLVGNYLALGYLVNAVGVEAEPGLPALGTNPK